MKKEGSVWKIITIGISIIALMVAWRSCDFAKESNNIAHEANGLAKQALEIQRPIISLDFKKTGEPASFIIFNDNTFRVEFNIENRGSVSAKNIFTMATSTIEVNNKPFIIQTKFDGKRYALAPGESITIAMELDCICGGASQSDIQELTDYFNRIEINKDYLDLEIAIHYNSDIYSTEDKKTNVRVMIKPEEVRYVSSDLE